MPLVHVVFLDGKIQCFEHPGTADAENDFLFQAGRNVPTVKVVCQAAIIFVIAGDIGIEKQYRDFTTGRAPDFVKPGLNFDIPLLDRDHGFFRQQLHVPGWFPDDIRLLLPTVRTESLPEIALPVK